MAPNLSAWDRSLLEAIINDAHCTDKQVAESVRCSERSVRAARSNLKHFGSVQAPSNGGGRPASITPVMLDAMRERLLEEPGMYQEEMVAFLHEEFGTIVTTAAIGRALKKMGWTKKTTRRLAPERKAILRDFFFYELSEFSSFHLVFVDESGCDKRVGHRRTGWSPRGVAPVQVARFHRGERYHILPAYAQDGIVHFQVYQGNTDGSVFEEFIRDLLPHCGRWPQPRSVLVMDNASIHHGAKVKQMCREAGVKLVYTAPYFPEHNPIEEYFAEVKRFIKREWEVWEQDQRRDFGAFLEWCTETVGRRRISAEGHFGNAGYSIDYP